MVYMGSKSKYANKIVPILQKIIDDNDIQTYIEPFVGDANIIDKIKCQHKIGYDKNQTLIALHNQAKINSNIIPEHGSSEWWYKAKEIYRNYKGNFPVNYDEMPLWEIGAIEFFASFSNGGFSRGYAKNKGSRDYYNEAYRNFIEQIKSPLYKEIQFEAGEYNEIPKFNNCLIYCDPPYQNTKPYGYKFEIDFNYEKYWDWVREYSKNNWVVCSEQIFPDDFQVIWEQEAKRTCGKDNNFKAVEKLGVYEKGLK